MGSGLIHQCLHCFVVLLHFILIVNFFLEDITKTCLYNLTPLNPLNSKTGVYRGIHYFSYLCSKT